MVDRDDAAGASALEANSAEPSSAWWQRGVVYQIYPRSFQDSDGDGVGDLRGIERRLDYLAELGIDAIWISPFYPSPMADFGYDVADYCDVDPRFGTLDDFDRLLKAAHARSIRIILDFVPNHTSDQHPWFVDARASRESPQRDYFLWRDPAPGGGPPNNWVSDFGGSAWEWDARTGQYYYHAFLKEQPDLNWRNPAVQKAMYDVVRFWLARGVDGFRIDVLWHLIKAIDFPDNPANPNYREGQGGMNAVLQVHSTDQPEVHAIAAELRQIADAYGDRVLIGEIYLPTDRLVRYYGRDGEGVHLPFNFQLIDARSAAWTARELHAIVRNYEAALPRGAWPNWVLGNHDRPRLAGVVGEAQARVAVMLLLTLRGTPTLYYGDELAISDVAIDGADIRDPRELREPGLGLGRDPARTPMPWDATPNAGFSTASPWLPLNQDWPERNVAHQAATEGSSLVLHRRLIHLRRAHPALALGTITLLDVAGDVLAYERRSSCEQLLVALNLGATTQHLTLPIWANDGEPLLSTLTGPAPPPIGRHLVLRPDEGILLASRAPSIPAPLAAAARG